MTLPNDAAVAIAEHVAGSVEEFCKMMTIKAKELGCTDTIFETPNGLDKGEHHSTALDMAIITRYALANDEFINITNTSARSFASNIKSYQVNNKNRLLTTYDGGNGVKTGFTNKAGQCFVGAAKRGDMQLISVALASGWGATGKEQKWIDTKIMLDYGFDNYKYYNLIEGEKKIGDINILNSKTKNLEVYINGTVTVALTEEEKENIKLLPTFKTEMKAPIIENQIVGELQILIGDEVIDILDIYVKDGAELNTLEYNLKKVMKYWLDFVVN